MPPLKPPTYRDFVIDFFDRIAPEYDAWAGGLHGRVAERLVEVAAPRAGRAVLDIGTGTGLAARAAARRVGRRGQVVGVDLADRMLGLARLRAPANTRFTAMDAERLVFRDAAFDLVLYADVLGYLEDPLASLEEARRALRPGGRVAVALRRRSLETEAQDVFARLLEELVPELPLTIPASHPDLERLGELEAIAELLETAGFGPPATTTMVTGARMPDPHAWLSLMRGSSPRAHALIASMGPALRSQFAEFVGREMAALGEDAFHYHAAFTFAVAGLA